MLINEVCKKCDVTKKAVQYYEKQGLIKPSINNSNYRSFDENDVALLKEIVMLRKLDISIPDIKKIITSNNRRQALADYKIKKELQLRQMQVQYDCINHLIDNGYNAAEAMEMMGRKLDDNMVIKDKLAQAFPGKYGMFLCLHFGRFLQGKIDSAEKKQAYYRIVAFLDNISELEFPEELEKLLSESFNALSAKDLQDFSASLNMAVNNFNDYLAENREKLGQYLEHRNSPEFKRSPAYKMQQQLIDFQKNNGYYAVFIPNLIILSDSYREYQEKLKLAEIEFFKVFPQGKREDD